MRVFFYKKNAIFLCAVIFLFSVFAQETQPTDIVPNTETVNEQERTNTIDETKILLNAETNDTVLPQTEPIPFFGSLWKFVLVLAFICLVAYVILRFLKKAQIGTADDPYLKVAASLKVAPNKTLYIILVKQEAFLIAVTEKDIRLISKLEDAELIDSLNLAAEQYSMQETSFAKMLNTFFNREKSGGNPKIKDTNGFQDSDEPVTTDFLHNLRNRLRTQGEEDEK